MIKTTDNNDIDSKKILISIAFGLLGFICNLSPLLFFSYHYSGIVLLPGLFFPLFIAVIWGVKYGLISALLSGCQMFWLLWHTSGYQLLISVPFFILWIIWHGFLSDLRMREKNGKWYQNIYISEIVFRVVSELVFVLVFVYLVPYSLQHWDALAPHVPVTSGGIVLTVFSHFFSGMITLLIIRLITRIKAVQKFFDLEPVKKYGQNIVIISIFLAIIIIIVDGLINSHYSQPSGLTFLEYLMLFDEKQILSRGLVLSSFIIYGTILQNLHAKYFTLDNQLKTNHIELERHQQNTNHILMLAADIAKADITDPDIFLSNLLVSSIDIIPEADHGFAFRYADDCKMIVAQKGLSSTLLGVKIRPFLKTQYRNDIIILENIKIQFLDHAEGNAYIKIKENFVDSKNSLIIFCEQNSQKTAGIVLNTKDNENITFSPKSLDLAQLLKNIPIAFYKHLLFVSEKEKTYTDIIKSIIRLLTLHNKYTKDHSVNVANLSKEIALCMGLSNKEIEEIYWAGMVHDIGKILVSDKILNKKGVLTPEEYEVVKNHTLWGYETLRVSPNLQSIAKYILYHHEKWDGTGYPHGLSGETIPLASRILAAADTFDALTSRRSYRKALSKAKALEYIATNANIHFDPYICDIFVNNFDQIIKNSYKRKP